MMQLQRFEADPENYNPRGVVGLDAIYLNEELTKEFITWSRVVKENCTKWVEAQKTILEFWAERLRSIDLRRCSLDEHIRPPLKAADGRAHKIAVLKTFFHWLRTGREGGPEKRLKLAEDPTAGLEAQVSRPAAKLKALPRERVTKALAHLGPPYRDALELQAETGWHTSEVVRFCESGEIEEPTDEQHNAGVAGILIVKHKGGQDHRTGVSEQVLQAGRRLRRVRGFSEDGYFKAIRKACRAAGVHSFGPGQLRHSVATWMVNSGVPIAAVSTYLGHRSMATTRAFYARFAVPVNPLLRPVK